ncbi:MAG: sugar transferase [Microbacteriaceae bacterium]|nr:sugar transferase [Microbacteriaceae bacterium]
MSQAVFDAPESATGEPVGRIRHPAIAAVGTARNRANWASRYRARLVATDIVIVVLAMSSSILVPHATGNQLRLPFIALGCALWLSALAVFESRNSRTIGTGATEYKAIIDATLVFLGVLVIAALLFDTNVRRSDVIPALPLGLGLLLLGRWGWRQWLRRERTAGRSLSRVVLVGSPGTIAHTASQLSRHPDAGYLVVGSIVPDHLVDGEADETGDERLFENLVSVLRLEDADTVMVTSSDQLTPQRMRRLSWQLERGSHRLVITPSLTDVAGSRIQTQPVAGLPLIHIEAPNYTGVQRLVKRIVDIVGSSLLLAIFAPALLMIALLIKSTSQGPVFYVQERIGRSTQPFGILKFRSMIVDADAALAALLATQGTEGTPLFKIQSDPRLTPIGAILRRFSLDELPQLVNVLRGEMSLVGPRPQRPAEVALYDNTARRRLAVRPGMTGLWQVSGRSRLGWDESLRLDLYYIENWSLTADLMILWRTFKAVVSSDGAY